MKFLTIHPINETAVPPTESADEEDPTAAMELDAWVAETREQIAGFDVLECASMAEAIEIASRHPAARIGTFQLRPFGQ